jgi:hypothetical protein
VQLHTLVYFTARPSTEEAYVLSVNVEKFSVMVPRFGIEAAIEWESVRVALGADQLDFDAALHRMDIYSSSNGSGSGGAKGGKSKQKAGKDKESLVLSLQVFGKVTTSIKVRNPKSVADRKLIVSLVHQGRDLDVV